MRHHTQYRLLVASALLVPSASSAQAPKPSVPPAKVRQLATIEGDVSGFVRLPSGGVLIYEIADSAFTYDLATKRRTLLGTDMYPIAVSPQGDRLAFSRSSEDRSEHFLWTMPIDPKTGIGTSPAHRVSLRPLGSRSARFSPDGKTLAYRAGKQSDTTWDITLIPATGGAEHVVASFPDREAFDWSVDGRALNVERRKGPNAIERVPAVGGPAEPLYPRTTLTKHWVVGLSPDARVALFQDNPDRFYYRTSSGDEGGIPVTLPPLDDGWGHDFSITGSRYTTMTKLHHSTVRLLDLASGKTHDLLPGGEPTSAPAWSPDGSRLAVLIGNLSRYEIAILNADGSGLRRYPLPRQMDGWGNPWISTKPWSPDGLFLAFLVRDRRNVAWTGDPSQLVLLNVTTGAARVLADAAPGSLESFMWRPDGRAITVVKWVPAGSSASRWTIAEVPLDGPERQLRDVSAEFSNVHDLTLASSREAVVGVGVGERTEGLLLSVDGSVARRLSDVGVESGLTSAQTGGYPTEGNRVLVPMRDGAGNWSVIKFLSTVRDSTVTMRLPFGSVNAIGLPNGKYVIIGHTIGNPLNRMYLAELDGSAPRPIGETLGGSGGLLAPSPDGRFLAYTSEGHYTSRFFELDFGPVLQALTKP